MMPTPTAFFEEQLKQWPLAAENYKRLEQSLTRTVVINGARSVLQVNPGRMASTAAKTTATAIRERPCFLCDANRPVEQRSLAVPGEPRFTLLVNPFPVFPRHFTIIGTHQPQRLTPYIEVLFLLARWLDDCVVFYNGPRCGASAPDHLHFQAGNKGMIPFQTDIDSIRESHTELLLHQDNTTIRQLIGLSRGGWLLEGNTEQELHRLASELMETLQAEQVEQTPDKQQTEQEEPMLNALCWYEHQQWHLVLFYRKSHRPSCYFRQDNQQRLISPAAVEMGGLVIAARQDDYTALTEEEVETIFKEVSWDDETIKRCSLHFLQRLKGQQH